MEDPSPSPKMVRDQDDFKVMKTIFVSTAIPYVNAEPHIGHALEYVQTDCYTRFQKIQENDIKFVTGSDENSLKNVQAAEKGGISTEELCKTNAQKFADFKKLLNVDFDIFLRTTDKNHFEGAQKFWKLCEKDIYKKKYRGLYCVGCEAFYTPDELVDGLCPEHKKALVEIEEENYFFRLSTYENKIRELIEKNEIKIYPETKKNEVLGFIKQGLQDFSISRSIERAHGWGVPVPEDSTQIMYVWFDALLTYINAIGFYESDLSSERSRPFTTDEKNIFDRYWINANDRCHVIGKGILRFHAVYWIGMLLSAGLPLPTKEFVHGYLTINSEKISKSIGNVISPEDVVKKYGIDATRYYLLREIPSFSDGDFSYSRFEELYNSDLANNLGNLVSRLARLSSNINYVHQKQSEQQLYPEVIDYLENYRFDEALKFIFLEFTKLNKFIDEKTPWKLQEKELQDFLKLAIEQLLLISYNLRPFLPETATKIQSLFANEVKLPIIPLFKRV
jgi:methionyl-tRNA synthetase